MNNLSTIIVVAYAIYPEIKSSEGIVNANWIDILQENNYNVRVFSVMSSANKKQNFKNQHLTKSYHSAKSKTTLNSLIYRIINKLSLKKYGVSYHLNYWKNQQQPLFNQLLDIANPVVWARVLPFEGLLLPLESLEENDFPLVINVNDPVVESNSFPFFSSLIPKTQCWTFPSLALATRTAKNYKLDVERCFVLPHAMRTQKVTYEGPVSSSNLKILYTGTFYKSAFTDELQKGLKAFSLSKQAIGVSFTFILAQYDAASIKWLEETLPDITILKKLEREEVLKITQESDLVLVVDAVSHISLLKGKLAEAISFGVPILGISYKSSVMDKVLSNYGCPCAYQNKEGDVLVKLSKAVTSLKNPEWISHFKENRKGVMAQFSDVEVVNRTSLITSYALSRHRAQKNNTKVPEVPQINNWP